MKLLIRLFFLLAIVLPGGNSAFAQRYSISTNRGPLLAGKDNTLTITVPNKKCADLLVTTDNGSIANDSCSFTLIPSRAGACKLSISVKTKTGVQKICDTTLPVDKIQCNPVCDLAGVNFGNIPYKKLTKAKGLRIGYANCNWEESPYFIKRYKLFVLRKSEVIFMRDFVGHNPDFDDETLGFLSTLQTGDVLNFKNIDVSDGSAARSFGDLNFRVIRDPEEKEPEGDTEWRISIISRKIIVGDTSETVKKTSSTVHDTLLAEKIISKVKAGKLKAYTSSNYNSPTPLTKTEISKIFKADLDTIEVEDVDGTVLKKITEMQYNFNSINSFKVIEKCKYNRRTGKMEISILSVAPLRDYYNEIGTWIGYKPLFWVDYTDVKADINYYDHEHPDHNFERAIWEDYMKKWND